MLRRPVTEIQLTLDDIPDYDAVRKEMEQLRDKNKSKREVIDLPKLSVNPKSVKTIHERIGYSTPRNTPGTSENRRNPSLKKCAVMKPVLVFYPDVMKWDSIGLLQGVAERSDDDLVFYVVGREIVGSGNRTIGYCSENTPGSVPAGGPEAEWLHVNIATGDFTVYNFDRFQFDEDIVCVKYDYDRLRQCDRDVFLAMRHGEHLNELHRLVNEFPETKSEKGVFGLSVVLLVLVLSKGLNKIANLVKYSTTAMHFKQSVDTLKIVLNEGKFTVRNLNSLTSKLIDFFFGCVLLYVFFKYNSYIYLKLNLTVELIIGNLTKLLTFLMGSPIGLKLNHAFNTTLGSFFSYHIFLWRTFMSFIKPHLYSVFYVLIIPASFGLSYQAAVVEDLLKFCTIHVYCIYNYAARLYGLQLYALISLWRLFIGRKYNPLRGRVDSYQYNRNQLFIGTLTFAILLFLLPTTLLYYVVFTLFHLSLKFFNYVLNFVRVLMQHLPIYSLILWVLRSPKIAGRVHLICIESTACSSGDALSLRLDQELLPLVVCVKNTLPKTSFAVPRVAFGKGLKKVFAGELL